MVSGLSTVSAVCSGEAASIQLISATSSVAVSALGSAARLLPAVGSSLGTSVSSASLSLIWSSVGISAVSTSAVGVARQIHEEIAQSISIVNATASVSVRTLLTVTGTSFVQAEGMFEANVINSISASSNGVSSLNGISETFRLRLDSVTGYSTSYSSIYGRVGTFQDVKTTDTAKVIQLGLRKNVLAASDQSLGTQSRLGNSNASAGSISISNKVWPKLSNSVNTRRSIK